MYEGRTVFSQLLDHLPRHTFRRVVKRYRGDHRVRSFTCWDHFYGTSENAVKTQIWIAITVYVLVAIVRKRLGIERDLYTLLQILSVTLLEKTELLQALSIRDRTGDDDRFPNQLQLFNF